MNFEPPVSWCMFIVDGYDRSPIEYVVWMDTHNVHTQVGAEDLVNKIKQGGSGAIDFDRAIGHPSVMPLLSSVGADRRRLISDNIIPNTNIPRTRIRVSTGASYSYLCFLEILVFRGDD